MLYVKDVVAGYGGVPALYRVSFAVQQGEIAAIVGSNGAGKSTLLRTISGLLKPMSGSIEFMGKRTDNLKPHAIVRRMRIAHVPEGRLLFGRMTVRQNLLLGAYTQKSKEGREETLEWVFQVFPILKERLNQLAGTMSGGEQQMLAIARGLMLRPNLLMLDEPSLGVMPSMVTRILEGITRVNSKGTTVLLVEQNVREALEICHHAYVLQTGRLVAEGTGSALLDSDLVRKAYLGI